MKRFLFVCSLLSLCSFGLYSESEGAGFPVNELLRAVPQMIPQKKEERAVRVETPRENQAQTPTRDIPYKQTTVNTTPKKSATPGQQNKKAPSKPVAAKPAADKPAAPTAPPAPMTREQFIVQEDAYRAGKMNRKDFIAVCDNALKDAESSNNNLLLFRALYARSVARLDAKDIAGAHADADKLIEVSPNGTLGYLAKFSVLNVQDKREDALVCLKKAAENHPDPERKKDLLNYAENYLRMKSAISPVALWKAFNDNEVAAEDQYKGKVFVIVGKISRITTNAAGAPTLEFIIDQYGMYKVTCEFPKEARSEIAKLKKDQTVFVSGNCLGMIAKSVFLRDCKIVE